MTSRRVVADIEANGFLDTLTIIHSLVVRDFDTGGLIISCTDNAAGRDMGYRPIREGLEVLAAASTVYIHNGIGFDRPALHKLYPNAVPLLSYPGPLVDTLVLGRLLYAHLKEYDFDQNRRTSKPLPGNLIGSHSLEAWGHRLGCHKGEYTQWCADRGIEDPWAYWRPEMQQYCEQDTYVGREVARFLLKNEGKDAPLPQLAVEIEHQLADYLTQQERNGWPFNVEKAQDLQADLAARREEVSRRLIDHFGSWQVPEKKLFVPKKDNAKKGYKAGVPVQKYKTVEFNPGSRGHIANRLQALYGWQPTEFTSGGQPKVDEDTLKGLEFPIKDDLMLYLLLDKRLGQIAEGKKGWMRLYQHNPETGLDHIHHSVSQVTITHRHRHAGPNIAQVPSAAVDNDGHLVWGEEGGWGTECRELFHVPDGWVQLGADASGLELRCLAHFMGLYDGGKYAEVILHGDVHSANRDALGLEGKPGRSKAKTFIYAFLYGSGDYNLGCLVPPPDGWGGTMKVSEAKRWLKTLEFHQKRGYPLTDEAIAATLWGGELKKRFLKNLPALNKTIDAVKDKAKEFGYIRLPDRRRAYIRHMHAALNTLLQGSGSIICKAWIVTFARKLTERFGPQGWDGKWAAMAWVHDEVQLAVRPEIAQETSEIVVESIREVTNLFNWRCPLDGEAKLGANWAECH